MSDDLTNSILESSESPDFQQVQKMLKDSFMTVTQNSLQYSAYMNPPSYAHNKTNDILASEESAESEFAI